MIRRLCQKSLAYQFQVLVHLPQQKLCLQQRLSCCTTYSLEVRVQKIQHLNYSTTIRCEEKRKKSEKTIDPDIEVEPIVIELQKSLQCSLHEAEEIGDMFLKKKRPLNLAEIESKVQFLSSNGATKSVIVKSYRILSLPLDQLKNGFVMLNLLRWTKIDDFVPLLEITYSRLMKLQCVIKDRIYYLAEYFSMEPHIISSYCSKHPFIFQYKLQPLSRKLDMLVSSNIPAENILRDLNVLNCAEDAMKERLEQLKLSGINRIMPWMIKCEDSVLDRTMAIRKKLGYEANRTLEILAKRLNWHGKTAISKFTKHEFLNTLNSDVVSELLDELLKVLSPSEITKNIKLLSLPLSHVQIRVAELTALEDFPISEKWLSMTDDSFKQHLEQHMRKIN